MTQALYLAQPFRRAGPSALGMVEVQGFSEIGHHVSHEAASADRVRLRSGCRAVAADECSST